MIIRCIDFETTGFPPRAGVCEVGWTDITVTADGVSIGETISHLCNPGMPISEGASKVNGITDAMVADAPASMQMFKLLVDGADVFCAHNAEFERAFFGGAGKDWLCTYKVALALYPSLPTHKNGDLPKHLGINLDAFRCEPLHRAGPDTYVTAMILSLMIMKGAMGPSDCLKAANEFIAITKRPREVSRMPFGKHKGMPLTELPIEYMRWASQNMDAVDVRNAILRELKRRAA